MPNGGAMSLDGFIAWPNGEYAWIVMDPDIDVAQMMGQFATFLIGRKTFEAMRRMGRDTKPTPRIQNMLCHCRRRRLIQRRVEFR